MIESDGRVVQTQGTFRHDAVEEFGQLMVVVVGDVEIGECRAENVMSVGLGTQDRIHIDAVLTIQQGDYQRVQTFVFHDDAADDVTAAIAVKSRIDHLYPVDAGGTSRRGNVIQALGNQFGITDAILVRH